MSAYLMSATDTAILAVYCVDKKLCRDIKTAGRILRGANNAALKSRYGDKPVSLRNFDADIAAGRDQLAEWAENNNPLKNPSIEANIMQLAREFQYQCCEGDFANHPGYALISKIISSI